MLTGRPPCAIGEYKQGRNSISFVHLDTGMEIILVAGKKRQAVVRKALHDAGTCDPWTLRRTAFAHLPPRYATEEVDAGPLSDLEIELLFEFAEENGSPSGRVAQDLCLSTAAVTRAAKSLAARGLLEDTGYAMRFERRSNNWQFIDKPKTEGGMVSKPGASTVWRATLAGLAAIDRKPSPHVPWKP